MEEQGRGGAGRAAEGRVDLGLAVCRILRLSQGRVEMGRREALATLFAYLRKKMTLSSPRTRGGKGNNQDLLFATVVDYWVLLTRKGWVKSQPLVPGR